jgi:hypothetical protein
MRGWGLLGMRLRAGKGWATPEPEGRPFFPVLLKHGGWLDAGGGVVVAGAGGFRPAGPVGEGGRGSGNRFTDNKKRWISKIAT